MENMVNKYGELFTEQLEIEASYKQFAEELLKNAYEESKLEGQAAETALGKRLMNHQFDTVFENVKVFVETTLQPKPGVKPAYIGILQQLADIYEGKERDLYTLLTMATFSVLLNSVFRKETRLSNLAQTVAAEVQTEARMEAFLKANPEIAASVLRGISERVSKHYKTYYAYRRMEHANFSWNPWSLKDSTLFGAKLIELVIQGSGYFELYDHTDMNGKAVTEIHPTQWLLNTWAKNEEKLIAKAYRMCPTVVPPAPWTTFKDGGYYGELKSYCTFLRLHDFSVPNVFTKEYMARLNQLDLSNVQAAINAIQETPWIINKKVLKVAKAVIARGGELAGIPRMEPLPELPRLTGDYTDEELKAHKQKAVERIRLEARRKSKAIRAIGHIKVAERFSKYESIYFPCNMDFRGRVYPIPSFSFQGDDLNKALLLFADAPACSSYKDIEWLMVHGANLAGVDKVSFDDRVAWVRDHEAQILDCAKDPMGNLWWADQDSPFQFLAFCFEWQAWREHEAKFGTPEGFKCGIPVAFDGTCSGLQHFSAILRDPVGGKAVNLIPADKPQDIYGMVAEVVNEQLKKDSTSGTADTTAEGKNGEPYTKFGTKTLAQQWLAYGVTRKVTKRSVMTLAYGSKEFGFRDQILEDTIEPAILEGRGGMFANPNQAAGYMAKLIWNAVRKVVVKAVEGMEWLQATARLVCKEGQVVTWMTPMGLPVQQSYMVCNSEVYRMRFSGIDKRFYSINITGDIDKRAQAQGIAPNFIHSMDAAHLQMTVLMAKEVGINHFSMIHDSYGAPVAQADRMFKTVREAFIKMYSENDVLEQFKADMEMLIEKGDKIPAIPAKGTLDLNVIRESLYTFH